jgi:RNA polymerase sigma-70 factor, ECF subfamily
MTGNRAPLDAAPRTVARSAAGARREDDVALGRRFAAGDVGAIAELYDRYAGPVFTVTLSRLGGDRQLAEEAVQDVFVKAWRAAASFDPERPLSPWLYEIARRSAADIARRESRRPSTTQLPPTAPAPTDDDLDAWEAWEVRRALAELSGDELELIRLTHFVGLSQSQIAERLAMPIGTVKSRVHRAHRRLAARLAHLRSEL